MIDMPVGDTYKHIAKNKINYLITNFLGTLDLHSHIRLKPVVKFLKNNMFDNCKVLELGCGDGINAFEIYKLGEKFRYVGFDLDERSINIARHLAEKLGINGKVDFYNIDITDYIFDNFKDKFDVILLIDFIEHIQNPKDALFRIKSLMKEGTLILVSVPTYNYPKVFGKKFHLKIGHLRDGFTLDELTNLFSALNSKLVYHEYNTGLIPSIGCGIYYRAMFKNKYLNLIKSLILYPFSFLDFKFLNSERFSSSLFAVFKFKG